MNDLVLFYFNNTITLQVRGCLKNKKSRLMICNLCTFQQSWATISKILVGSLDFETSYIIKLNINTYIQVHVNKKY